MKKAMLIVLGLLLVAGAYLAYRYQQTGSFKTPEFVEITNVQFKNLKLPPNMAFTFTSDLTLNNPNPFSVDISGLDFDVFLDGKKATHIIQDKNVTIGASSDFTMPLSFEIPIDENDIFANILELLSGAWKNEMINIKAVGTIDFEVMGMEIGLPFDYQEDYRWMDYLQ